MSTARVILFGIALTLVLATAAAVRVETAKSQTSDPCATVNARLAGTGRGDRDFDGLSNCTEKRVVGTSHKDPDSDDDGVDDGDEVDNGTDPLDDDSDDDGLDDGEEDDIGSNPDDKDSDDDGEMDGDDPDPADELESKIESNLQSINCPTDTSDGSLVLLGISIVLTPTTEFEDGSCADLADKVAAGGPVHVEVEVTGDATTALVATEVEGEDMDGDGSPEDVDDDDDDDGVDDDEDDDDDGDGVPDDEEDD